jgi:hypothetical protein
MNSVIVALLAGIGGGAWIYAKMSRQTGGNTKSALTVAAVGAAGIFVLVWTLFGLF